MTIETEYNIGDKAMVVGDETETVHEVIGIKVLVTRGRHFDGGADIIYALDWLVKRFVAADLIKVNNEVQP